MEKEEQRRIREVFESEPITIDHERYCQMLSKRCRTLLEYPNTDEMRRTLDPASATTVVYHSPCNDGFGAAFVAWLFFRSRGLEPPRFVGARHQDAPPDVTGERVLVVDISWPRATMEKMHAQADAMLILDHHKTAQAELADLEYAFFDMDRSGVVLSWGYFFSPDEPIPSFLYWIGLRDLWRHRAVPDADAFTTAFPGTPDFEVWNEYYKSVAKVRQCVEQGKQMLANKEVALNQMASNAVEGEWRVMGHGVYPVRFINQGYPWTSDLGNHLVSGEHSNKVAFLWSKKPGEPYSVSLRSAQNGPDVGVLAAAMNGGGHPHAAGFRVKENPEALIRFE